MRNLSYCDWKNVQYFLFLAKISIFCKNLVIAKQL